MKILNYGCSNLVAIIFPKGVIMNRLQWCNLPTKPPSWTPPRDTDGLIWQVPYPVIFITFVLIFV